MDDGDHEAVSCCSSSTSRWSSPRCGSDGPQYLSDREEAADRTPDRPSAKLHGSKLSGCDKSDAGGKKGCEVRKQKVKHEIPKLPAIRAPQGSKPSNQSANMTCMWLLKSQVWDLQQQLSEARTENKLLKKTQHRHTVAQQQHFRDTEDSFSQILAKHNNETRALQGLLRETRLCRDNLARQLQAMERRQIVMKDSLQHLQQLSQDRSLLEREELTLRLARSSTQLEDKDRRIQNLERTLELQRESFRRQIESEQRKIREARNTSSCLQQHIHQLTRELQLKEKQVQKHNIYYHRIVKGPSKKGKETKQVQTDDLVHTPQGLLEGNVLGRRESLDQQESSHRERGSLLAENPERKPSENSSLQDDHPEDESLRGSGYFDENTKEKSCSEESPEESPEQRTACGQLQGQRNAGF